MTEAEWLECTDPEPMLKFLRGQVSHRKLRLFAVAYCRRIWNLLHDKRSRKAVECTERFADGKINKEELSAARKEAEDAWWQRILRHRGFLPDEDRRVRYAAEAAKFVASATGRATELCDKLRLAASASLGAELLEEGSPSSQPTLQRCHLLRDIFGNPFRPSPPLPPAILAWNDGAIRRMAEGIYEERELPTGNLDTARLAILSDALLDAGCADEELIAHCRSAGPHVRGCWVVDLILGKE
jgi:hypothetical protein